MMRKALTYSSFLTASLMVIVIFITARTYTQLVLAMLLYIPLAFFAFKVFRGRALSVEFKEPLIVVRPPVKSVERPEVQQTEVKKETVTVTDIDKRAFLKLIGGVGLSVFIFSLINRKVGGLLPGGGPAAETVSLKDTAGNKINPVEKSPTDGYRITEINGSDAINYFGFTDNDGAWYVMMQDTDGGAFRYARGTSSFSINWANRERLRYDYYNNVFK